MLTDGSTENCPWCGGPIYKNIGDLYVCLNSRSCGWRGYSFSSPPQPKSESEGRPGSALTSSQVYIEKLRETFGYESKMQIYRLRERLGDIEVERNTSAPVVVIFYPSGGVQQLPVPPAAGDFQFVSGPSPRVREARLDSGLKHPKIVVTIDPLCSGNPLSVLFHLKF